MATINLGSIKFNWKGTYAGGTAYVVDDVVEYNGSSYICILASTGNLPTNATYFEQMSSAGTDGTDLTSTLTTQGDIVYRDASGLARLPAGSANQVLQSGGTGANPSWGTVSSDMVKLAQNTTGNALSISTDGYFSSTYKSYKVIYDLYGQNNSTNFSFRFNVGGSAATSNSYIYTGTRSYRYSGGGSITDDTAWNTGSIKLNNGSGNANYRTVGEINIYNVGVGYPHITANGCSWNNTTEFYGYVIQGLYTGTTNPSGFTFFFDGGGATIVRSLTLYGLK
jgi:hypothetical protein